ncbi:MAG: hypothetical protein O3C29_12495 [Proteobacteria bacterium]|nr:hypothetical protein [Pseudomonadota bacterium]
MPTCRDSATRLAGFAASPFGRGLTRTAAALSYLPRATAITGARRLAAARVRLSQSGHRID